MTIDKQGRGAEWDESRIERENKRPVENVVSQTQQNINQALSGEKTMPSIAGQLELLSDLKKYLVGFQDRLEGVSNKYQEKVDKLHEGGLIDEIYRDFTEQQLAETRALIARLIEHIEHNDIPAVEREIRFLESR